MRETESIPSLRQAGFAALSTTADSVAEAAGTLPVSGARLGRYVILYPAGRGGMGEVFAAYDPALDRKVAVKLLRREIESEAARNDLRREARTLAQLAHPNIVTVYDLGAFEDREFVAMEFVDGTTLSAWLAAEERPWREILAVFLEAGRGLAAAHAVGLVHRDFKPGNVMIDRRGGVRVLDFGLARWIARDELAAADPPPKVMESDPPGSSLLCGTPSYMAPERRAGRPADARSDQYSFCVALYEALPSGISGWVRRALTRGLSASPEERHATMEALLAALSPASRRSRRAWLAAAGGALLAGSAAIALLAMRPPPEALCKGGDTQWTGVWDAGRKEQVRQAFLATGSPLAGTAFRGVESTLDRYKAAWLRMHEEACRATRVQGGQSEALLDLRMICLERRRTEAEALIGLLATMETPGVGRAVEAAEGLEGLAGCADRQALLSVVPPPAEPGHRTRAAAVRRLLGTVKAQEVAGQYRDALQSAEIALASAEDLGYRPLVGEAKFLFAQISGRLGRHEKLRENLVEALAIAQETRHLELQAQTASFLIVTSFLRGDLEEARLWWRLSGGAVAALGGRRDLDSNRHFFYAMALFMAGRLEDAITSFETSLRLDPDPTPLKRAAVLSNVASAQEGLGRLEESRRTLESVFSEVESRYGPEHPTLVSLGTSLGEVLLAQGRYEDASAACERAVALSDRALGADHPDVTPALTVLGEARIGLDQARQALPPLERAVRLRAGLQGNPQLLADSGFQLARALRAAGQDAPRALRLAREARAAYSQLGERGRPSLAEVDRWLAAGG